MIMLVGLARTKIWIVSRHLFVFLCFRVCWNRDANCHSCASLSLTHVFVGFWTMQTLGRAR